MVDVSNIDRMHAIMSYKVSQPHKPVHALMRRIIDKARSSDSAWLQHSATGDGPLTGTNVDSRRLSQPAVHETLIRQQSPCGCALLY